MGQEAHAGVVWLQFGLAPKDEQKDEQSPLSTLASISSAAGSVGEAVGGGVAALSAFYAGTEGRARSAILRCRRGFGTCRHELALFAIVTEEGTGSCFYYCYPSRELAESYFDGRLWRLPSRILFSLKDGMIDQELRQGGPPIAHNTIRLAARTLQTVGT